jgi:hypothetical protein
MLSAMVTLASCAKNKFKNAWKGAFVPLDGFSSNWYLCLSLVRRVPAITMAVLLKTVVRWAQSAMSLATKIFVSQRVAKSWILTLHTTNRLASLYLQDKE